jgi:hypothetical protein
MPFPGHESKVTRVTEELREGDDVFRKVTFVSWLAAVGWGVPCEFRQLSQTGQVMVCSRHNHAKPLENTETGAYDRVGEHAAAA